MRRIILLAIPIIGTILLLKPASTYLNKQSSVDPAKLLSKYDITATFGQFHGTKITVPLLGFVANDQSATETNVLSSKSEKKKGKRIEIDLSKQKLYAYEGSKKVHSFLVSTGKWGRTPTGEFRIWTKLQYALMTGGSKALNTYYYLPNVPNTMYFYNRDVPKYQGYGIHGAYWHNNFGHPMSHGCINMKIEDSKTLFDWATQETADNGGTKIVIYGTAPTS